jgi:hypothetical protein
VFIVGAFCLLFGTDLGVELVTARGVPVALLAQAPGGTLDAPAQHIDVPVPSMFANPGQLILAVMYILGTAINAFITLRRDKLASQREERNRQWAKEDAAEVAKVAQREAAEVRTKLEEAQKKLSGEIAHNTEISRTALNAANNVNEKIAAVGALRRSNSALRRDADIKAERDVLAEMHTLAEDPEKRG